jgi:hypothetical protein
LKGVELPVNALIIVIIGIVVLLALVALFFGVYNPGRGSMELDAVKNSACSTFVSMGCVSPKEVLTNNFDADKDGVIKPQPNQPVGLEDCSVPNGGGPGDNLYMLCKCWYGADFNACRSVCMCGNRGDPSTSTCPGSGVPIPPDGSC